MSTVIAVRKKSRIDEKDLPKVNITCIKTKNDTNGNSRKGFLVTWNVPCYDAQFFTEHYNGTDCLPLLLRDSEQARAAHNNPVVVAPSEWNRLRRECL